MFRWFLTGALLVFVSINANCPFCENEIALVAKIRSAGCDALESAKKYGIACPYVTPDSVWYGIYLKHAHTYSDFSEKFHWLIEDHKKKHPRSMDYFQKCIFDLERIISGINKNFENNKHNISKQEIVDYQENIDYYTKFLSTTIERKNWALQRYPVAIQILENGLDQIRSTFFDLYSQCIAYHNENSSRYQRGLINFEMGKISDFLEDIQPVVESKHIEKMLEKSNIDSDQFFFFQGVTYSELGDYQNAIRSLTKAIEANPDNKEAYFQRAVAYFENGDIKSSLSDYLVSEVRTVPLSELLDDEERAKKIEYASGLIQGGLIVGAIEGISDGIIDFIPSLYTSVKGIGTTLWAFAINPIEFTNEFVTSCKNITKYIQEHTPKELFLDLAPELKELISSGDSLNEFQQGELIGQVLGKYGVYIFSGAAITKGMKAFSELKRANQILTFKTALKSEMNASIIIEKSTIREKIFNGLDKKSNLKIQWDKQGKHIAGHKNYNAMLNKSLLTHPSPQELINKYAGTGIKVNERLPGVPGFQELVNFNEVIGTYVDEMGVIKMETTWGKIHYAKDGVHIVPAKPRK